jgi:CspA family cold shock protein
MATTNGTIKRLVHDKGFGFIAASDGSEYFFHQSSCQTPFDELREGQAVTFEKGQGPKGPRGENVKLAWTNERSTTHVTVHPIRRLAGSVAAFTLVLIGAFNRPAVTQAARARIVRPPLPLSQRR